jgi:hypothetical protein
MYNIYYGGPGSGKTHLTLTHPGIVLVDFENGYLTATSMGLNVPVIQPETEEDIWRIFMSPKTIIKEIHKVFPGYEVKTWGFDSATSLQWKLMGRLPTKADPDRGIEADPGSGILSVSRNRVDNQPSIEDYRALSEKMTRFFNCCMGMEDYDVVVTAHSIIDEKEESPKSPKVPETKKTFGGYPNIVGKLKYHVGGSTDMFLYLEQDVVNDKPRHTAYSLKTGMYGARTRFEQRIDYKILNPSYQKLKDVYDKARGGVNAN